jgi:hypothetical protein
VVCGQSAPQPVTPLLALTHTPLRRVAPPPKGANRLAHPTAVGVAGGAPLRADHEHLLGTASTEAGSAPIIP